uniref:Uncharacterized protein n=1 Tax=Globodera rostochiensis TaxID=31243 RepID=A0A914HTN5_GLORO
MGEHLIDIVTSSNALATRDAENLKLLRHVRTNEFKSKNVQIRSRPSQCIVVDEVDCMLVDDTLQGRILKLTFHVHGMEYLETMCQDKAKKHLNDAIHLINGKLIPSIKPNEQNGEGNAENTALSQQIVNKVQLIQRLSEQCNKWYNGRYDNCGSAIADGIIADESIADYNCGRVNCGRQLRTTITDETIAVENCRTTITDETIADDNCGLQLRTRSIADDNCGRQLRTRNCDEEQEHPNMSESNFDNQNRHLRYYYENEFRMRYRTCHSTK